MAAHCIKLAPRPPSVGQVKSLTKAPRGWASDLGVDVAPFTSEDPPLAFLFIP
jgi:hypothetical protein